MTFNPLGSVVTKLKVEYSHFRLEGALLGKREMSSHAMFAVSDPVPEALSSPPETPRKKTTRNWRKRLYELAIGIGIRKKSTRCICSD